MDARQNQLLCDHLARYVTEHKRGLLENVLRMRTRHITLVLEDIYQSQNASAVVRTCECLGIQDIHIIENYSRYMVNRKVLKGSHKWVDLVRYKGKGKNNTALCFENLRANGYQICVTDPGHGMPIEEVPVEEKLAVVMGNELRGASPHAASHADRLIKIPMVGFTESFNISVSAAICLNSLLTRLRHSAVKWQLTDEEKETIRLQWLRKMVRHSDIVEREFIKSIQ
jgi:tRNA (guanosine-2'-O-)-methyltransferase